MRTGIKRGLRAALAGSLLFGGVAIASVVAGSLPASAAPTASLFVAVGGTGDCTTMANACGAIQTAVNTATGGSYAGDDVTINVAAGTYTEDVLIGASTLNSLTIAGAGAATTTVNGAGGRVFFNNGGTVTISGLTVTNGSVGILNLDGTVSLTDSTVSGNTAGIGGIENSNGILTLTDSTVSGNTSEGNGGGILIASGTVTLTDSTVSGNTASANGGGIENSNGILTLTDSTVSGNSAGGFGGGIGNGGTATVGATIVAGNTGGVAPNCTGNALTSVGYNLTNDGGTQCDFTQPTDVVNADPLLGVLANNGGPTQTMLPAAGPAVGVIPLSTILNSVSVCPRTDQRGVASVGNCSIGAVEVHPVSSGPITIITTSLPDATVGQPYSFQLLATGGTPPYTWNKYKPVGSGALPWHVTLSRSGLISGTPKHAGTYTIIIKCLDSTLSHKTQAVQTLTLTVHP